MPAGMNSLTHRQKVDRLITDLHKQGVSSNTVAPPLFRLLWALGFHVPPPFFLGFFTLTLLMGAFFGILWGALMWLLQWPAWHLPVRFAVVPSAVAGVLFGLSAAGYYRWKAARLRLPPWESYPAAMPKALPSRKASQTWMRFWIPFLVSLVVTPFALVLGLASIGGGHGSGFLWDIFFPYTVLMVNNGFMEYDWVLILPALVQFPIYGIILGFATAKRKIIPGCCLLLAVHLSAIGFLYAPYAVLLHESSRTLIDAVNRDDAETVRITLEQGGDPNVQYPRGSSLLKAACANGRFELAKLLLEKGADINYRDRRHGLTALHVAVEAQREEIVQLLISKGVDLTIKDRDGYTALERTKKTRDLSIRFYPKTYPNSDSHAKDERIISLLEAAEKDKKKP